MIHLGLSEFIDKFVAPNSIIRLWIEYKDEKTSGHKMLSSKYLVIAKDGKYFMFPDLEHPDGDGTAMSWEVTNNKFGNFVYLYRSEQVKHVTSIFSTECPDAINIVLDDPNGRIKKLNDLLNQCPETWLNELSGGMECENDASISEE